MLGEDGTTATVMVFGMPADKEDPIADTGMFRAFVAKGEPDRAQPKSLAAPAIVALLIAVVLAILLIWWLSS